MKKSEIMKNAWAMYRAAGCTMRAEFSIALKAAWAEAKAPKKTIVETLTEAGCRRWTAGNNDRIYFNHHLNKMFGLDLDNYNTGNICYGAFNGERISNRAAGSLSAMLNASYYDVKKDSFVLFDQSKRVEKDGHMDSIRNTLKMIRSKCA